MQVEKGDRTVEPEVKTISYMASNPANNTDQLCLRGFTFWTLYDHQKQQLIETEVLHLGVRKRASATVHIGHCTQHMVRSTANQSPSIQAAEGARPALIRHQTCVYLIRVCTLFMVVPYPCVYLVRSCTLSVRVPYSYAYLILSTAVLFSWSAISRSDTCKGRVKTVPLPTINRRQTYAHLIRPRFSSAIVVGRLMYTCPYVIVRFVRL